MLLGGNGLRLGARFTHAWSRPEVAGLPPILAQTAIAAVDLRYPLVRRQAASLWATGGAGDRQPAREVQWPAAQPATGCASAICGSTARRWTWPASARTGGTGWRLTGTLELRHGLDIWGASAQLAWRTRRRAWRRAPCCRGWWTPTPSAFLVRAQARAELRLARQLVLDASVPRAQYSDAPLPSYEAFALGNFTLGRGFDPGALSGDKGVALTSEISFPGR
jgi:hemolysin activation/secretion protein